MTKSLNIKFEQAVRMLVEHFSVSTASSRKPVLFHDIRVGVYLYENGHKDNIVLAGLLHDSIEWSDITQQMLVEEFGDDVVKLVLASTKDDSIADGHERIKELIKRCVHNGQDALIVKTADILDSFKWYASQNNKDELDYCKRNADAIFAHKLDDFDDKIFDELKEWHEKFL